jgi:hypothetical protein
MQSFDKVGVFRVGSLQGEPWVYISIVSLCLFPWTSVRGVVGVEWVRKGGIILYNARLTSAFLRSPCNPFVQCSFHVHRSPIVPPAVVLERFLSKFQQSPKGPEGPPKDPKVSDSFRRIPSPKAGKTGRQWCRLAVKLSSATRTPGCIETATRSPIQVCSFKIIKTTTQPYVLHCYLVRVSCKDLSSRMKIYFAEVACVW